MINMSLDDRSDRIRHDSSVPVATQVARDIEKDIKAGRIAPEENVDRVALGGDHAAKQGEILLQVAVALAGVLLLEPELLPPRETRVECQANDQLSDVGLGGSPRTLGPRFRFAGVRPDRPGIRPPGQRPDRPGAGVRPDRPGVRPDRPTLPGSRPERPGASIRYLMLSSIVSASPLNLPTSR